MQRSLKEAQDRVKALEERLAALPAATAPGGTAPTDGSPAPLGASTVPPAWTAGPDGSYTEEQLTAFGKLADEVQKRKDAAAMAERVKRELARAGVSLTPDQEAAVLKLQQSYREKMQDLFKNGFGTNEAERNAAMEKRDALKNQFESDLRSSVPASEADKIVEAMKRGWPGFFPRQRQDTTPGSTGTGMGGARHRHGQPRRRLAPRDSSPPGRAAKTRVAGGAPRRPPRPKACGCAGGDLSSAASAADRLLSAARRLRACGSASRKRSSRTRTGSASCPRASTRSSRTATAC